MMDLANEIVRKTYHKSYNREVMMMNFRTAEYTRERIKEARRVVLSASMSKYVAELAQVPFNSVARERRDEVLSSLRHSAKLPFKTMFVQLDAVAFRDAVIDVSETGKDFWGHQIAAYNDQPTVIGWLIEQGTANQGSIAIDEVFISVWFDYKDTISTIPFYWVYKTGDTPFRRMHDGNEVDTRAGMFGHGITGLHDPHIGVVYPRPLGDYPADQKVRVINESDPAQSFDVHSTVPEFGGGVRYVLGFLAAFNDTPKTETLVSPTKQYVAGGMYRKQLSHDVIHLNLPGKMTMRGLAKRVIAAIRKGHHEVRAHWRVYVKPGDSMCASRDDHIWSDEDLMGHAHCKQCKARRTWITLPNGRGDVANPVPKKSRYYVTHD